MLASLLFLVSQHIQSSVGTTSCVLIAKIIAPLNQHLQFNAVTPLQAFQQSEPFLQHTQSLWIAF
jgi:hypothetical protein